jgi:hypothetical protein
VINPWIKKGSLVMPMEGAEASKLRAYDLAKAFVAGPDRSLRLANELEKLLEMCYPNDRELQDLAIALACYRPEGGPHLYNEDEMVRLLGGYLSMIRSLCPEFRAQDT